MNSVPDVTFMTREGDQVPAGGGCAIGGKFVPKSTKDFFSGKRVILFSLPGAFTPTCSTYQLPGFDERYEEFKKLGIDEIYCVSVNDAFVMNEWSRYLGIKNVKLIPDGNGEFTRLMGMLVDKRAIGFGLRSHRYAAVVTDGKIEQLFAEPGFEDNHNGDPYGESSPDKVMAYLQQQKN